MGFLNRSPHPTTVYTIYSPLLAVLIAYANVAIISVARLLQPIT